MPLDVVPYLKGCIPALLCIATIVGNSFTIISIFLHKRLRRRETNILMVNLALADLLVGLFVMPLAAMLIFTQGYWPLGPFICRVWISLDVISCTASIVTLCVISIDRYVGVSKPWQYRSIMTRKRLILVCVSIWIFSIITLLSTVRWTEAEARPKGECFVGAELQHVLYSTLLSFFLPTAITMIVYFRIYRISSIQRREYERRESPMYASALEVTGGRFARIICFLTGRRLSAVNQPILTNANSRKRKLEYDKQAQSAKVFGMVVLVFLICWLPFFTVYLIDTSCKDCSIPSILFDILTWLGYVHSTLNPIIYALLEKTFGDTWNVVRSYAVDDIIIPSSQTRRWQSLNRCCCRCLADEDENANFLTQPTLMPAKCVGEDDDVVRDLLQTPHASPRPHPRAYVYGSHYRRMMAKSSHVQTNAGQRRPSDASSITGAIIKIDPNANEIRQHHVMVTVEVPWILPTRVLTKNANLTM